MKIATIVFTYNRSFHTKKVLDALSRNRLHPEKLFIIQDGLKQESHREEWEKVRDIIENVDWCNCEVIVSNKNRGLSQSIISGISRVLESYDAAIILEDDCVPHPMFMEYMVQCLTKYQFEKQVYSVGGYAWPVHVHENGTDAYFTGRISSWGWGTWRDRWAEYEQDYKSLVRIKSDPELFSQFHVWAEDAEGYLVGNVDGHCDSWAVFWILKVIEKKGYCLAPYRSLIENIGFDGSGVHCGTKKPKCNLREEDDLSEIILPEEIEFPKGYEAVFSAYFTRTAPMVKLRCYNNILVEWMWLKQKGVSIAQVLRKNKISKVSIWGRGKLSALLLQEIEDEIAVESIIESNPSGDSYQGIPIVNMAEISRDVELIIVIPVYDMDKILKWAGDIVRCRIVGIDWLIAQCLLSER